MTVPLGHFRGFLLYQLKSVKMQCSAASAEQVCAPDRIFLWDSLKWLGGLSPSFPVTCLVPCTEHMFYFILVSIITTGFLFTAQTKCCLSSFLCGGDERRSNTWEKIMFPWCGGTGDYVVVPSGTSVSMKYRLLHPSESKGKHALGETKKDCALSCSAFI